MDLKKGLCVPQLEIEKRYLITSSNIKKILHNNFIEFKMQEMEQFYLLATIGKTLRYRKEGERYIKNIKKGNGLVREEFEEEVSKSEYNAAKKNHKGGVIKKRRYYFTINNYNFELDIFKGKLKGLRILEVEFQNIEEAKHFQMPKLLEPYIIKEITNESIYSNGALSQSMQIPLRDDAKISFKKIVSTEAKKLPKFDIYISQYENGETALKYMLQRLLISLEYQVVSFVKIESIEHLLLANKALNRYRTLLKIFKRYIKKESYREQLLNVNSLLILFEKTVEREKSFRKLLKCKRNYPLKEQNTVLQTLIKMAHLRKKSKERLLEIDLTQKVKDLKKHQLQIKKRLEKPFEYIVFQIEKKRVKRIKKEIKKGVEAILLYNRLKEYKLLLNLTGKKQFPSNIYEKLKKYIIYFKYSKVIKQMNKKIAHQFLIYCKIEKKVKKIYKLLYKEL